MRPRSVTSNSHHDVDSIPAHCMRFNNVEKKVGKFEFLTIEHAFSVHWEVTCPKPMSISPFKPPITINRITVVTAWWDQFCKAKSPKPSHSCHSLRRDVAQLLSQHRSRLLSCGISLSNPTRGLWGELKIGHTNTNYISLPQWRIYESRYPLISAC